MLVLHDYKLLYHIQSYVHKSGVYLQSTLGPALILRQDAIAWLLADESAAFIESCAAIGWKELWQIQIAVVILVPGITFPIFTSLIFVSLWFQECQSLECSNTELRFQIRTLQAERDELRRLWNAHVQRHGCVPNAAIKPRLVFPVTMGNDSVNEAPVTESMPSFLTQAPRTDHSQNCHKDFAGDGSWYSDDYWAIT